MWTTRTNFGAPGTSAVGISLGRRPVLLARWFSRWFPNVLGDGPQGAKMPPKIMQAIWDWEETCDLDFRCPQAGRFPRNTIECGNWAYKHAQNIVDFLKGSEE